MKDNYSWLDDLEVRYKKALDEYYIQRNNTVPDEDNDGLKQLVALRAEEIHKAMKDQKTYDESNNTQIEIEKLRAKIRFLTEQNDDIEEIRAIARNDKRKNRSWLKAWYEDNQTELADLTEKLKELEVKDE